MANDFFKNGDKAYSENLNDGILVGNAFDWTVDISLPTDTGSVFPNSSTVVKAKVADVYITPNSNLSIGSTISNSSGSSQVYRLTVYPNFNRFGGFKSISLTADSGVTFYIANKGANTPIANNLDYDNLGNVPELKVLKEYDIVLTIPNGKSVSGLEFVFQSSIADVSASITQANVTGLTDDLSSLESGKADTVHSHNSSQVREINALPHIGTNARANQSGINVAVDEKVGSLSTSITNLMGFKLVHSGASDKIRVYSNGLLVYFTMQGTFTMSANADTNTGTIPSQYAPNVPITVATHSANNNNLVIQANGILIYHNFISSTSQTLRVGVVYPLKASLP